MCLILFAYKHHPNYRLILAANRDEFYERPTAPLMYWEDHPHILAGRDLKSMGTWMGITSSGRFAAVTNYREPGRLIIDAPSRGHLVSDYLNGTMPPNDYLKHLKQEGHRYNGFNLLVGDTEAFYYFSNRSENGTRLESGIHGLSNRLLDTPWPKVVQGKQRLSALIDQDDDLSQTGILDLVQTQAVPPNSQIPDTGVGMEWERTLAPIFITSPNYGTRCSTLLTISRSNHVHITEITWQPAQPAPTLQAETSFDFNIEGKDRSDENRHS
ncbi:MAG: NRDE family protein [Desulfobacteraceae bacterium]|jgi:uncharacterized protein with NRDE domain